MRGRFWLQTVWSVLGRLFWSGLWLIGLGLLLGHGLRWSSGDRFAPAQLLSYFFPWQLVVLLPALLVAGWAKRGRLGWLLALPTLITLITYAPLFLPRSAPALAAHEPLKVMSFNVFGVNQDFAAVTELIRREQPDILLLQEAYHHNGLPLLAELGNFYPDSQLYKLHNMRMGQMILSRYPLQQIERPGYIKGRTLKARVETPAGPVSVWNTHPYPPLRQSSHIAQISNLAREIAQSDGPLIVGGDFNTTDQAETYQLISRQLDNAHWEAGWGFGFSFPARAPELPGWLPVGPLVRIDHIFYSDHFMAHSARTLPEAAGSDHFPVVAELVWTEEY